MKSIKKSIIAIGLTAVSALALGIGVSVSGAQKVNSNGFMGSYNLTAYAEEATKAGVNQITVAGKEVDITTTATFTSNDEAYTLCLTVIDLEDFGKEFTAPLQIGYEIAEGIYYNGITPGLSKYVYSSITFGDGETKLSISDLSLDPSFYNPYFIVAEVATSSINNTVPKCIVAEQHNLEYVESTPSTCSVAGNLAYYHCTDEGCDKYFTDSLGLNEIVDLTTWKANEGALELEAHTEAIDEAKAPTCTESGLTEGKHCSVCGTVTVAQTVVEATGHTEVVDKAVAATCTEDGLTQGSHCSVCNEVTVAQTVVPATGHTEVTDNAVAATCTKTGLTEGKHCSVCGTVTVAQTVVEATGHTEVTDEAVEATCTQTGLTEGKHCSVCNTILTAQTEIPAKGHTTSVVSGQAATCTEDGWNDYYTCSVCGSLSSDENGENVISDLEAWKVGDGKLDAFGHSYINYICTTCGDLEKVAVNGVYYQFTVNDGDSGYHFVACGKADGFSKYTGVSAETLVLENEIGGYPVTAIGADALANLDGHALRSVVIPSNIVYIGERAFLDNVGMQKAVFLAPEVTMAGSFSEGEDGNTTPFYGCSLTENGTSTALEVYYNSVVYNGSTTDLRWTRFRRYESSPAIYKRYYIGCDPRDTAVVDYDKRGDGALYSKGSWSMVNTTISGAEIVTECTFADVVNANVKNGIYFGADNKVTQYTQTQGDELKTKLEEALAGYTSNGTNKYVVNVTVTNTVNSIATVAITVSLNVPVEVKVNSAIAFGYDLENQSISAGLTTMRVVKSGDNVILYNPTAANYTFLGWAKEVGGALTFIESTTQYNADTVYYAIWGTSKVGTAFSASIHTNGSTLVNPTGDGIDGKWYDNSWNEVTSISLNNLVVYTRTKFEFTYKISGAGVNITDTMEGTTGKDKGIVNKNSYSYSFDIWEGQKIVVTRSSDKYTLTFAVDDVQIGTIKLNNTFILFGYKQYSWHDDNLIEGVWTNASVNGNSSVTFVY